MKKFFILTLAVVAMATGCSKNDTTPNVVLGSETPLALRASSMDVDAKAPYEGVISGTNKLQVTVPASLTDGDYTTAYALGTMTFADQTSTVGYETTGFTGQKSYPADASTNVYLAGLYPAAGWGGYSTTAAFTFTGKEDVMAAPQVATNKGDADAVPATFKNLAFTHKLTKLEITVIAEDAEAAAAWGDIEELTLTESQGTASFANVATVTLKDAATAFSGTATSWPVYVPGSDDVFTGKQVTLTTTAAKVGYTMVAPITATGTKDFTIGLKAKRAGAATSTSKNDIAVNLVKKNTTDPFTGSTAANSFAVTLTFKAKTIQATASVTDWIDGGNSNSDVD